VRIEARLQPVGAAAAAAVVQFADTNKGTFTHNYQSEMSLLVTDFTCLDGRDGELVIKKLAAVESHSNRATFYVFMTPTAGRKYQCLSLELIKLLTAGVIGIMAIYRIQSWKLSYIARYHLLFAIYCFRPQKMTFINNLFDCIFIHITQLGCPQHPDMCLPTISCTFLWGSEGKW
jgi:hypothetical protein